MLKAFINPNTCAMKKCVSNSPMLKLALFLVIFSIQGLQFLSAQNALALKQKKIEGLPKLVSFDKKGISKPISLLGKGVAQMQDGRLLNNNNEATAFNVLVTNKDNNFPDVASISLYLKRESIVNGDYNLEIQLGKEWVKTDVVVRVNITAAGIGQPILIKQPIKSVVPLPADFVKIRDSRFVIADTEANARKQKIQDALKLIPKPPVPTVSDWYPKSTGALEGSLVLVGRRLNEIVLVKIGSTELKLAEFREGSASLPDLAHYSLPKEPLTGDLTIQYKGSTGLLPPVTIESGYKTVDQFGPQWPAMRATFINASPVPMLDDASTRTSTDLNQGRIDAMRLASFYILIENIPGNVLKDASISLKKGKFKLNSGTAGNPVYRQADASGNTGFQGNAAIFSFIGYSDDVTPSTNLEIRNVEFEFSIRSYINTASFQTDLFKTNKVIAKIEYNSLKEYVITNTAVDYVERLYDFQLTDRWGVVEGTSSNADGSGSVAVGRITLGNDIAFRIASGPIGTKAKWFAPSYIMPHGWVVSEVFWQERRDYPANEETKAFTTAANFPLLNPSVHFDCRPLKQYNNLFQGPPSAGRPWPSPTHTADFKVGFFTHDPVRRLYTGAYIMKDGNGPPRNEACNVRGSLANDANKWRQYVKGSLFGLEARSTMQNNHRVTFTLSSIKVRGPHGKSVAEAMRLAEIDTESTSGSITMIPSPIPLMKSDEYNVDANGTTAYPDMAEEK